MQASTAPIFSPSYQGSSTSPPSRRNSFIFFSEKKFADFTWGFQGNVSSSGLRDVQGRTDLECGLSFGYKNIDPLISKIAEYEYVPLENILI